MKRTVSSILTCALLLSFGSAMVYASDEPIAAETSIVEMSSEKSAEINKDTENETVVCTEKKSEVTPKDSKNDMKSEIKRIALEALDFIKKSLHISR